MKTNKLSTAFYISFLKINLSNRRKKQFFYNILTSIISALFELFSVVSILPIISLLNKSDAEPNNNILIKLNYLLSLLNINNIPLVLISIFSLFAIASSLIRLFNHWYSAFIAGRIGSDLGIKLYRNILNSQYKFFLKYNSGKFTTALTYNIQSTVVVIQSIIRGISSLAIILVLIISLLFYQFKLGFFIISFLILVYLLIYKKTKNKLINNGQIIYKSRKNIITDLKDSFSSIRNIIIHDSPYIFINKYSESSFKEYSHLAQNNCIQILPKYLLEAAFFSAIGFLGLIISVSFKTINPINFLGLISFGCIKMLPALQQLFLSISQIKANQASLLEISNLLDESIILNRKRIESQGITEFKKSIKFDDVSFKYTKESYYILKNISLEISKGDRIGICGETGSGKSTLVDLILGLLSPTQGKIILDGEPLQNTNLINEWSKNISHVPQLIFLCDTTIIENIAFGLQKDQIDLNKAKKAAKIAQIHDYIERLPQKYYSRIGEDGIQLSGGQKQRIGIARAIYNSKDLLILDEATSSLDRLTEKKVLDELFKMESKTIVFITHKEETFRNCDKVFKVNKSKIFDVT